jgi:heme/copper-type cytochrome/quinol oxidase subunit 4
MRSSSNTIIYIVAGIIILHFVVGFIWLIYKLNKKKEKEE